MSGSHRAPLGQALLSGAIAAIIGVALHRASPVALAPPPSWNPRELLEWFDEAGTPVASMALLRVGAMATAAYVVAAATLLVATSLRPSPRLLRAVRRSTPSVLRRAMGVGALTTLALPAAIASSRTPAEAPPVLVQLVEDRAEATLAPDESPPPTLVWESLAIPPSATTAEAPAVPVPAVPAPPSSTPLPSPPLPSTRPATWQVQPGDHFWSIAVTTVQQQRPSATAEEIDRYWRTLVDINRDRLALPDDPDLLFAGQELELPPLSEPLGNSR